jgi:hypothetical protein
LRRVQTFTTGYCREEQDRTRWRFAGFATATGAENTMRPRAFYRNCCTCTLKVMTLGGLLDVPDALGLCLAVLVEYKRLKGQLVEALFDEENVLGELNAYIWHLYNRWDPAHGAGTGTFRGYATAILRQKIKTFVARDNGDVAGGRTFPKAYSRSVSTSWEGMIEQATDQPGSTGLEFAFGSVAVDPTADRAEAFSWLDTGRHRAGTGVAQGNGCKTHE